MLVTVKNHREHDIDLYVGGEKITINAGTYPDKNKPIVPGSCSMDSKKLDALKSNPAVRGMFDEGWLTAKGAATQNEDDAGAGATGAGATGAGTGKDGK